MNKKSATGIKKAAINLNYNKIYGSVIEDKKYPKRFDSTFEQEVYDSLLQRGIKVAHQPGYMAYTIEHTYTPDILINGKILLEVKGYHYNFVQRCRDIQKAIQQNPDLDIRFIWQKDIKFPGTKMKVSRWCDKCKIKYAIGSVPEEWLHE